MLCYLHALLWQYVITDLLLWASDNAFQFIHIHDIPAGSVLALLVCVQTLEMAKLVHPCGKLCFLWLVGLAFSDSDCHHFTQQLCQWIADSAL